MICIFRNKYIKLLYMYNNLFKNYSKKYLQDGGAKAQTVDQLKLKINPKFGKIVIFGIDNDKDKVLYYQTSGMPASVVEDGKTKYTLRSFENSTYPNLKDMELIEFDVVQFFNREDSNLKINGKRVYMGIGSISARKQILAQIQKQFNISDAPDKKLAAPQLAAPQLTLEQRVSQIEEILRKNNLQ